MTATAVKPKGLGKGLSALMSDSYSQTVSETRRGNQSQPNNAQPAPVVNTVSPTGVSPDQISIESLQAGIYQPRRRFTEEYLHELADSIEKNGIMQPILVRPSPTNAGMYEIIAGERRFRAAKLAKLATVPVIIRELSDKQALELALVENIQRQDLSPLEEASGYQRLMDEFDYTQEELASTVGKSRSHIANLLRLQSLPESIKLMVDKSEISAGHARALLGVDNAEVLAKRIVAEGLSVRQTEQLVKAPEKSLEKIAQAIDKAPQSHTIKKTVVETKQLHDVSSSNLTSNSTSDFSPNVTAPSLDTAAMGSSVNETSVQARDTQNNGKSEDVLALEAMLSNSLGLNVSINSAGHQKGEVVIGYSSLIQLDEILRRLGGGA